MQKSKNIHKSNDLENKSKKLRNNNLSNEDYSEILTSFSMLGDLILEYGIKFNNTGSDTEIIKELSECRDKIPMVLVWGMQSSGKTALLNKIFGMKLKSCHGIGTRCAIEIHAGPSYSERIIVRDIINGNEIVTQNMEDAEKIIETSVEQNNENGIQVFGKIIYEICNPIRINVLDLPGCVNKNLKYFEYLKQEYLMKPETIILHVVNGTYDPATDLSAPYLNNVTNKIIKVLTHADSFIGDEQKLQNLYLYDKESKNYSIALVSNKNKKDNEDESNETELFEKLKIGNTNKELIKGSSKLKELMFREYHEKIHEFLPIFKECTNFTKKAIDKKFESVQRQKPDMKNYVLTFKTITLDLINKEFGDGSDLAFKQKALELKFTVNDLRNYDSLIPSEAALAKELKMGIRKQVQGTEGWNDLFQKYVSILICKIKDDLVITYVNNYCDILVNCALDIFNKAKGPFTDQVLDKIRNNLLEYFNEMQQDATKKITEMLNNIELQPCSSDNNYVCDSNIDLHKDVVKNVLIYISKQINRDEALQYSIANIDDVLRKVMKGSETNDFYLWKGKNARTQIINFWKSKCVQIHDSVIEIITKYDRSFEKQIQNEIHMVSHEELVEPEYIVNQRQMLHNIYDISEKIFKIVERYI